MQEQKKAKNRYQWLYGTCPDMETARAIASQLLDRRLVACVNLLPGMVSLYHWQGKMEEASEVVFIAKSRRVCWAELSELYTRLHPYEEPSLVALDVSDGLPGYLGWIDAETGGEGPDGAG